MQSVVDRYINELKQAWSKTDLRALEPIAEKITNSKKVLIMGNGGSASTAQHFTQGLRDLCITAISLTDNSALLTAIANDNGYRSIFKEQIERIIDKEDLVIGISASGNSPNVLDAIDLANEKEVETIGLMGFDGGKLKNIVDDYLLVPSFDYGVAEDIHLSLCHIICEIIEENG